MTGHELYEIYTKTAAADRYIIGFTKGEAVYAVEMENLPYEILRESVTSSKRHAAVALRVYIRKAVKAELMIKAEMVGTVADLTADNRYNRGDNFERMVCERYGIPWKKDSTLYTEAGDLTVNGIAYQIKFDGASVTNEYTLRRNLPAICG